MPIHASTYSGGMDRDSSKNKYQPNSYYKMKNMRLTSFEELSNGAVQSIEGNTLKISCPDGYTNDIIIGHCIIRNYLVVFSTITTDAIGGRGTIWKCDLSISSPTWSRVYQSDNLMFTTQYPIFDETIGYYEDSTTIKIYWTDNFNMIRFINIMDTYDLVTYDCSMLNILPNVTFIQPQIINISAGNLNAGKVQYSYQYYNIGGIETTFSPCTPLIHLTKFSESLTGTSIATYEGVDSLDEAGNPNISGKSVTIQLTGLDTDYDRVRIISIHYRNLYQEPDIYIIGEYDIQDGLTIIDTGVYTKGTLTLNGFRTLGSHELYCKTIEQKGNKAVIGNITEKFFDIDFDARAYRFAPHGNIGVVSSPYTLIVNNIGDLDLALCTNTKLRFDPITPPAIAALTNDSMGIAGTVNYLKVEYNELLTGSDVSSGIANDGELIGVEGWDVIFSRVDDNTVNVRINNFQAWAEARMGVDPTLHITDVNFIGVDCSIFGDYESATLGHDISYGDGNCLSTIVGYNHVLDRLDVELTDHLLGTWFTDFVAFETGTSTSTLTLTYTYEFIQSHIYETSDPTDVTYTRKTAANNPPNWLFDIDLLVDTWWTLINPFNSANIISVDLELDTLYWHTAPASCYVTVYNSLKNSNDVIVTDAGTGNWPNSIYQMIDDDDGMLKVVPENHDCINSYNYDNLYSVAGVLSPQIDERATYADPTDLGALNPDTNQPLVSNQFKWQSNLTTLGGEGPNIKYEFITEDIVINESNDTRYSQPDIVTINNLTSYDSYKNPLREAYLMSYKHDEVYRHGLVAVNTRGQESFVKWIGDIKIPTIQELTLTDAGHTIVFEMIQTNTAFSSGPTITTNPGGDLSGTIIELVTPAIGTSAKKYIRLSGTSGTAAIMCNGLTYTATFNTDLETTARNFVTANAVNYATHIIVAQRTTLTYVPERRTVAHPVGIKFTINTTPLVALDVVGLKIVRVERKESDRTIYSQGIISNMFLFNSYHPDDHPYPLAIVGFPRATIKIPTEGININRLIRQPDVVQFISPEINLFKSLSPISSDYLKLQAKLVSRFSYIGINYEITAVDIPGELENTVPVHGLDLLADVYYSNPIFNVSRYIETKYLSELDTHNILEGVLAGTVTHASVGTNSIIFTSSPHGNPIVNRSLDTEKTNEIPQMPHHEGISGTCLIALLDSDIDETKLDGIDEFELYLVDYKRNSVAASQYGGLTYNARQNNIYIECGQYIAVPGIGGQIDASIYGGDTYIGFFNHLKTVYEAADEDGDNSYDINNEERFFAITSFPCESHINLDLIHGERYEQWFSNSNVFAIREEAGTWDTHNTALNTLTSPIVNLVQEDNMYLYNTVYSQQNTTKEYFARPSNWLDTYVDDTLLKISLEKYPREEVDSFIKFLTDNEKILPSEYGPINKLFLFRNYMIVFMEYAIGTISIDERALLPIQNNSILELGAGENLKNFDYISNKSGTVHPQSVSGCGNGFIWYDAHSGSIGYYNGETQDIGLVKGMSSPLKAFADKIRKTTGGYYCNQLNGGSVMSYENQTYKETMCAFVMSGMASFTSNTGTIITLATTNSPGSFSYANVVINGIECIARTVSSTQIILYKADNPSVSFAGATWPVGDKYLIYYKDLSTVYSFSNIINAFMHEVDMFPTWMFEYNNKLYDVFGKFAIYQENNGNYGSFYNIYRNAELEYVINPKQSLVSLFNNYEYSMEAYDQYNVNTLNETWDYIRIKNDYQYSASTGYDSIFTIGTGYIRRSSGAAHGLSTGDEVMFSGLSLPAELSNDIVYYAIRIDGTNFIVTTSLSVAPITFAAGGTGNYHTIEIPISSVVAPINDKRRFRTWRIKDLRDMREYIAGVFKPRIRDTHIRLKFKYLHGDNKRILMHDLYTYYSLPRETIANQK